MLPCYLAKPGPQRHLEIRHSPTGTALRGSVLGHHPAGPALRDPKRSTRTATAIRRRSGVTLFPRPAPFNIALSKARSATIRFSRYLTPATSSARAVARPRSLSTTAIRAPARASNRASRPCSHRRHRPPWPARPPAGRDPSRSDDRLGPKEFDQVPGDGLGLLRKHGVTAVGDLHVGGAPA